MESTPLRKFTDPGMSGGGNLNSSTLLPFFNLSEWQRSKLAGITKEGIRCYLKHWIQLAQNPVQGTYCDVAWDEIYCWPPTAAGKNISRPCSEVMKDDPEIPHPEDITGNAYRICREDGSWEWNGWTNYNACIEALESLDSGSSAQGPDISVVNTVRYIFFIGSVLSFLCILVSLIIFYYFKSLRCDRITVQIHLMLSLLLRCILMIIISEPFVFQRTTHYRSVNWTCKTVIALQLYATVASISWMFVQGHYLHARVTTRVFDRETPLRAYYGTGWGIPLVLILTWVWTMEKHHKAYCWKNYGNLDYIWIIIGPMLTALVVNLLFLINIMRILLTKIQLASISSDSTQCRRAVKATLVLFPLLGANNLLFLYNPGGEYEAAYMITNASFQASQGIFVSLLYCFLSREVRDAFRREYRRFKARRSTTAGNGAGVNILSNGNNNSVSNWRDRRRTSRHSSFCGGNINSTPNNAIYYPPERSITTNVTYWHNLYRSASSSISKVTSGTQRSPGGRASGNNNVDGMAKSIFGMKQEFIYLNAHGMNGPSNFPRRSPPARMDSTSFVTVI